MKSWLPRTRQETSVEARGGFTLTELLVVLAVLAILASLLVSAHAGGKDQTKVAQCAGNLRQLVFASQIYSSDNQDKLPTVNSGSWAWDLPASAATAMLNVGCEKKTFYCPGTQPRFTDNENFLAQGLAPNGSPACLWNFGYNAAANTGFHICGYAFAFAAPSGSFTALDVTNQNKTILPERVTLGGSTVLFSPAQRVLVADAVISVAGTTVFTDVPGGFYIFHLSPHLTGRTPVGGNAGFKDGHVEWHKFQGMVRRTVQGQDFWW